MTTLTEKILTLLNLDPKSKSLTDQSNFQAVEMEFTKALDISCSEARKEGFITGLGNQSVHFNQGKAAGLEDAAKIVDSIWERNKNCDPEAAQLLEETINAIRLRAKELK